MIRKNLLVGAAMIAVVTIAPAHANELSEAIDNLADQMFWNDFNAQMRADDAEHQRELDAYEAAANRWLSGASMVELGQYGEYLNGRGLKPAGSPAMPPEMAATARSTSLAPSVPYRSPAPVPVIRYAPAAPPLPVGRDREDVARQPRGQ
jgi:hypothetical protein